MKRILLHALRGICFIAGIGVAQAAEDVPGKALYKAKCGGCHSIAKNRIGPRHEGVFGRVAGSLSDFKYSPALKASEVVWNDETLDSWLANPAAFIPGQRMFVRVGNADDRGQIIAYLKRQGTE